MRKEKIFSKLNITNYNNQLEDILEKKAFSEGTKNILLNILYKMETAYEDYSKVKIETDLKKNILEEIIKIIKTKCNEIELVKPRIDEQTILEDKPFIIDKNKIISYPNEKNLYYALCHLENDTFKIGKQYSIFQKPFEDLLNLGYIMDLEELIRDFDGWAWNIVSGDIENYTYNLVYQNIKILLEKEFLINSIKNANRISFIDKLEKQLNNLYSEEVANKIKESIYIISVLEYIAGNEERKQKLIQEKEKLDNELMRISDKKGYLQLIANEKKKITRQIKPIDEALNNNKILKAYFKKEIERNGKEEKTINLSEYVERLQERRKKLLKDLRKLSNLMKPMNYVKQKFNLQKKCDLLNKIDFNKELDRQKSDAIIKLQINFLKAIQEKISKEEVRKRIIEYVYILRYYKLIYLNQDLQVKDVEKLKEYLKMTEKYLITRCCNFKIMNIFSHNIEKNYEIISKILESNIVDLDELNIEFKKKDGKIVLNIYDDNMIDKSIEYDETEDINVKLGKKVKLFI